MLHLIVFATMNGPNKYNHGVLHLKNLLTILGRVRISRPYKWNMHCAVSLIC